MSTQALISAQPFSERGLGWGIKAFAFGGMGVGLLVALVNLPAALGWAHLSLGLKAFMTLFPLGVAVVSWRLFALRRWAAVVIGSFMGFWTCGMMANPLPVWQPVLMTCVTTLLVSSLIVGRKQLTRGW